MLNRILVPLDGSERAETILGQLRPLLRRNDAEVLLARSVFAPPGLSRIDTSRRFEELRSEADTYLRKTSARQGDQGIRTRSVLLEGPPQETLLAAADREKADLIAMTTHGRSGIARWVLGSVTEKLIRAANVPLLIVRSFTGEGRAAGPGEIPFRRILVPTDGSDASKAVFPVAIELAKLFESEVVILHSTPGPATAAGAYSGSFIEPAALPPALDDPIPAEEIPRHAAGTFSKAGLRVTTLNVLGDPASQIVDLSIPHGIDLIAIATHGRSGLSRWLLGSVTEKVLRAAPVPLLVVRSRGKS